MSTLEAARSNLLETIKVISEKLPTLLKDRQFIIGREINSYLQSILTYDAFMANRQSLLAQLMLITNSDNLEHINKLQDILDVSIMTTMDAWLDVEKEAYSYAEDVAKGKKELGILGEYQVKRLPKDHPLVMAGADFADKYPHILELCDAAHAGYVSSIVADIEYIEDHYPDMDDQLRTDLAALRTQFESYTDVVEAPSVPMLVDVPVSKPKVNLPKDTLVVDDSGVGHVHLPKDIYVRFNQPIAITLGKQITDSTAKFESDIFNCLAIRTAYKLGSVLLLALKDTTSVKLTAGTEIGTISRK